MGTISLVLVLGLRRYAPVVPASLVAVVFGILAVQIFDLDRHGVAIVGPIDSGLPSFGLPSGVHVHDYLTAVASSIGIMLVGFAEGLGAAKSYATANHYEVDPNRELIGLGTANLGAGLCSGMVVNGSLSKTAVNVGSGARSQLSGLVVAVLTIVTLLFLTGLFENLPEATLAAAVIAALIELVDIGALVELYRLYTRRLGSIYGAAARPDFIAAVAAMFGVLLFDTLPGLFIGIAVSFLLLLYRASKPHIAALGKVPGTRGQYGDRDRHPENDEVPGVAVVRVESGLFFANAEAVRAALRRAAAREGVHGLVLDAESVAFVDVTAVRMLEELAADLSAVGVQLALAHDIGQVRDMVNRGIRDEGAIDVYRSVQDAVDALTVTDRRGA